MRIVAFALLALQLRALYPTPWYLLTLGETSDAHEQDPPAQPPLGDSGVERSLPPAPPSSVPPPEQPPSTPTAMRPLSSSSPVLLIDTALAVPTPAPTDPNGSNISIVLRGNLGAAYDTCALVRELPQAGMTRVSCPGRLKLSRVRIAPPLSAPGRLLAASTRPVLPVPVHLTAALAAARACLRRARGFPSPGSCLMQTGEHKCAANESASDALVAAGDAISPMPTRFRVVGGDCAAGLHARSDPLVVYHQEVDEGGEVGRRALEEPALPPVPTIDTHADAAGGASVAGDAAAGADEAVAAREDAADESSMDEEVLPLEQWKEAALKRLQTEAIMGEGSLPGAAGEKGALAGAADGASGGAAPFVRPTAPLKDRFNYLTSDVGAKVLAKSEGMTGSSDILNDDRDRYMMTDRQIKKKWATPSHPIPMPPRLLDDLHVTRSHQSNASLSPSFTPLARAQVGGALAHREHNA